MLRCVFFFLICGNYCKYRAEQLCLQMKTAESLIYKTAKRSTNAQKLKIFVCQKSAFLL